MGHPQSLTLSVAPVLRRAGVRHPVRRSVRYDELRVADAVIEAGTPIELDLVLEATGNAVVASGRLRSVARCQCRRCLESFDRPIEASVREVFEPHPVEGETYPLRAEHIELGPFIRDAALLALPLAPLCREDCLGPAPLTFPTGVVGPVPEVLPEPGADGGDVEDGRADGDVAAGAGAEGARDPRWAALDQLQLDR